MGTSFTFERVELHRQVWSKPMSLLCKEFKISDRGLKKICVKLNVPTPCRGYWRRIERGAEPVIVPLPITCKHIKVEYKPKENLFLQPDSATPDIKTIDNLRTPHDLIKEARRYYALPEKTRWQVNSDGIMRVGVSKATRHRAYCFLNTLIKELELRGAKVIVDKERNSFAQLDKQKLIFSIQELSTRVIKENEEQKKLDRYYRPTIEFIPNGILAFRIEAYSDGLQTNWKDGKRALIENRLGEIVRNFKVIAEIRNKRDAERELERIEYEKEETKRREKQEKIEQLQSEIKAWNKICEIEKYLAFLQSASNRPQDWVEWIQSYLEEIKRRRLQAQTR